MGADLPAPRPGHQSVEPSWRTWTRDDGTIADGLDGQTWYVDLVTVADHEGGLLATDLYLDVMLCPDGRHPRLLDLDELADAVDAGLDSAVATDGLRRFQAFLDRHVYPGRRPSAEYADFPPAAIAELVTAPPSGDRLRYDVASPRDRCRRIESRTGAAPRRGVDSSAVLRVPSSAADESTTQPDSPTRFVCGSPSVLPLSTTDESRSAPH